MQPLKIIDHIRTYFDLYAVLFSWAVVGAVAPNAVAIGWSSLTFLLLLRTANVSKIVFGLVMMLVFSDSRMPMFDFAETAKIVVVVVLFIYVMRNYGQFRKYDNRIFRYFLPFLVFGIAATLWSEEPFTALQKSISYALIYFTVPLLFMRALDQNKQFGVDLIWFFVAIFGIGLVLYVLNPVSMVIQGRYHGLLGNPNGLGIFHILVFPLVYLFWRKYRDEYDFSKLFWIFIVVFGASLLLTGSRTALFAILIFVVFSRLRYFTNWATIIGFLALIISYEALLQQLPSLIRAFGMEDYLRVDTLREGSGRNIAWAFAWQKIDDVFFAGGGFGYTEYIYQMNYSYLSRLGHQGNAHNSYLTIWLDTGLIGLVIFATGLLRTIIYAVKVSLFTLPIIYSVLFSTYYESWLAASLNPFTSVFLFALTFLSQREEIEEITASPEASEEEMTDHTHPSLENPRNDEPNALGT